MSTQMFKSFYSIRTFGSRALLSGLGLSGLRLARRGVGAGASSMPAGAPSPSSLRAALYLCQTCRVSYAGAASQTFALVP